MPDARGPGLRAAQEEGRRGWLHLTGALPEAGTAWTDTGEASHQGVAASREWPTVRVPPWAGRHLCRAQESSRHSQRHQHRVDQGPCRRPDPGGTGVTARRDPVRPAARLRLISALARYLACPGRELAGRGSKVLVEIFGEEEAAMLGLEAGNEAFPDG